MTSREPVIVERQGSNGVAAVAAVAIVVLVIVGVVVVMALGGLNWFRTNQDTNTDSGAPDVDITVPLPTALPQDPPPDEGGSVHWEMTW